MRNCTGEPCTQGNPLKSRGIQGTLNHSNFPADDVASNPRAEVGEDEGSHKQAFPQPSYAGGSTVVIGSALGMDSGFFQLETPT